MKLNVVFSDGDTCIPDVVDKTINFSKSEIRYNKLRKFRK